MAHTIVGLLGRAQNGKSTAASYLEHNYGFRRIGFAHPLREMAKLIFGFNDDQVYGTQKDVIDERWGLEPRHFLKQLGYSGRKCIYGNVWVDACLNAILSSDHDRWCIEDMRHLNEAEAVSSQALRNQIFTGYVLKLVYTHAESEVDPDHPTEREVDLVPAHHISRVIEHTESEDASDLKRQLDDFLSEKLK